MWVRSRLLTCTIGTAAHWASGRADTQPSSSRTHAAVDVAATCASAAGGCCWKGGISIDLPRACNLCSRLRRQHTTDRGAVGSGRGSRSHRRCCSKSGSIVIAGGTPSSSSYCYRPCSRWRWRRNDPAKSSRSGDGCRRRGLRRRDWHGRWRRRLQHSGKLITHTRDAITVTGSVPGAAAIAGTGVRKASGRGQQWLLRLVLKLLLMRSRC